jgi:hypothetical protein
VRPDLRRHPAGDLGHRREQRQRAVRQLHGLVRHGGDPGPDQRLRAFLAGRQVQIGEQHLARSHPVVFLGDRFLDLENQIGLAPHVVGGGNDPRTGGLVLRIGECRTSAGVTLDQHLMPATNQLQDPGGCDRHPVLVVLELARYSDLHGCASSAATDRPGLLPGPDCR